MIPRTTKDSIGCHFDSHKNEEITKPSHIIPGYTIGQSGSCPLPRNTRNLRMQHFNNDEAMAAKHTSSTSTAW